MYSVPANTRNSLNFFSTDCFLSLKNLIIGTYFLGVKIKLDLDYSFESKKIKQKKFSRFLQLLTRKQFIQMKKKYFSIKNWEFNNLINVLKIENYSKSNQSFITSYVSSSQKTVSLNKKKNNTLLKNFNFVGKNAFLIEKKIKKFTKKRKSFNFEKFQKIESLIDFVHPERKEGDCYGRKNYFPEIFQPRPNLK